VTQYHRLAKTDEGISAKYMRQFYIAITVPKMQYVAKLFLVQTVVLAMAQRDS